MKRRHCRRRHRRRRRRRRETGRRTGQPQAFSRNQSSIAIRRIDAIRRADVSRGLAGYDRRNSYRTRSSGFLVAWEFPGVGGNPEGRQQSNPKDFTRRTSPGESAAANSSTSSNPRRQAPRPADQLTFNCPPAPRPPFTSCARYCLTDVTRLFSESVNAATITLPCAVFE
jgi:hypothetical protein